MGKLAEILSSLQEAGQAMQEYDPVAFEEGRRIVDAAQETVLDDFEFCPCCGDILQKGHECN